MEFGEIVGVIISGLVGALLAYAVAVTVVMLRFRAAYFELAKGLDEIQRSLRSSAVKVVMVNTEEVERDVLN